MEGTTTKSKRKKRKKKKGNIQLNIKQGYDGKTQFMVWDSNFQLLNRKRLSYMIINVGSWRPIFVAYG